MNKKDSHFLNLAIEKSKESAEGGLFPAGAVLACDDKILSSTISSKWPQANHHAESDAIDEAINNLKRQLSDCTLYSSMEPCLMCLSRAYWAGVRRIAFAIRKESTKTKYFEGTHNFKGIVNKLNEKMEFVHMADLEGDALKVVKGWEEKGGFNKEK